MHETGAPMRPFPFWLIALSFSLLGSASALAGSIEGTVRETEALFLGHATRTDEDEPWEREQDEPVPLHLAPEGRVSAVAAHAVGSRILLWVTDWYEDLDAYGVGSFVYTP